MPGVLVEVTSPALIEKVRSATSDTAGQYRITNLPVGTYTVKFSLEGFQQQVPSMEVAACCDLMRSRAERFKSLAGSQCETYSDFRKLIERKDLDAVVIAVNGHWHCLPVIHACAAGKHVYAEKPLAWVQLETNRETFRHELSVRYWPGGEEPVTLSDAHPHGAWIAWRD